VSDVVVVGVVVVDDDAVERRDDEHDERDEKSEMSCAYIETKTGLGRRLLWLRANVGVHDTAVWTQLCLL
jgi:hypothetical protein